MCGVIFFSGLSPKLARSYLTYKHRLLHSMIFLFFGRSGAEVRPEAW